MPSLLVLVVSTRALLVPADDAAADGPAPALAAAAGFFLAKNEKRLPCFSDAAAAAALLGLAMMVGSPATTAPAS